MLNVIIDNFSAILISTISMSIPLIFAAMYGRLLMVEYRVERGANMEAQDYVSDVII